MVHCAEQRRSEKLEHKSADWKGQTLRAEPSEELQALKVWYLYIGDNISTNTHKPDIRKSSEELQALKDWYLYIGDNNY